MIGNAELHLVPAFDDNFRFLDSTQMSWLPRYGLRSRSGCCGSRRSGCCGGRYGWAGLVPRWAVTDVSMGQAPVIIGAGTNHRGGRTSKTWRTEKRHRYSMDDYTVLKNEYFFYSISHWYIAEPLNFNTCSF